MAQIYIIKDLQGFGSNSKVHVNLSSRLSVDKLLSQGTLEPVKDFSYDEHDAQVFIKDYIDLIAGLNGQHGQQLLWWATDLSSKNRYMSQVPDHIQELVEILGAVSRYKDQPILIVDPQAAIEVSLREALKNLGVPVNWRIPPGRAWFECFITRIRKIGGVFYNAMKYYGRSVLARFYLKKYFQGKVSKTGKYYVIKTFTYRSSWDGQGNYQDTIFGRLPEFLSQKKVLIWTFDSRNFKGLIKEILKDKGPFLLPVEFFLTFNDFATALGELLAYRIPIKDALYFRGIDVSGIVRHELAKMFNGVQLIQYLHYHASKNLAAAMGVETVLLSYENNPWERMCALAIKKHAPGAKVLGYSHSVLPQASLNMFISSKEKSLIPLPDKILVNGRIPMEIMKKYGDYSGLDVETTSALRYEYLFQIARLPRMKVKRILVILDGVKQTKQLVDYILSEIKHLPDYQFIFRAHPALPWSSLARRYGYKSEQVPNLIISTRHLTEDLKNVDLVIYWQSTVAIEALSMGKPLVNFSPNAILSFDPLYGFSFLKWTVAPGDALSETLAKIYALSDEEFTVQYGKAKDFIGQYFYPVDQERLRAFGV